MAELAAAKRYAQAAFDIAVEAGTIALWRTELNDVAAVLSESEAARLLSDERIPLADRQTMVARMLDVSPLVLNLAKLLIEKGRSGEARAVSQAFDRMADDAAGIVHAQITTAVALSDQQVDAITAQLGQSLGKTVRTEARVDPAIVGGVIVRVGDRLVDGSVRTRLKRLREELEGARYAGSQV